jgi:RNA 2',3'-cyclic 3'-phosphodiesterase
MTSAATVEGRDRLRLFCALTLPDTVLDALGAWQERELRDRGRIVPRANLHVTVAFLGSRPAADVGPIAAELRAAAGAAGPMRFGAVRYGETRNVGMVVLDDADERAGRFALDLFGRLERLGVYTREQRPWLAHVTVIRFRRPPHLRPPVPALGEFSPSGAAVYHSVLRSGGAQYEVLESVSLGG